MKERIIRTRVKRRGENSTEQIPSRGTILALISLLLILAIIIAYIPAASRRKQTTAPFVSTVVDVSRSHTSAERRSGFAALETALDAALPRGSEVHLWQFDRDVRSAYHGLPNSSRDLWGIEDEASTFISTTHGTYIGKALAALLPEARRADAEGRDVAVIAIIDGGDDDPTATRRQVAELAKLTHLKAVWLVGPRTADGLRSMVETSFAALGQRLIVSGKYDMASGFQMFRASLQARTHGDRQ